MVNKSLASTKDNLCNEEADEVDELAKEMSVIRKQRMQEANSHLLQSERDHLGCRDLSDSEVDEVVEPDPLYDPDSDDVNQKWMDNMRRSTYRGTKTDKTLDDVRPLFKTDAVLNCPACFTTLCADCQRHAVYANQYRAMFVMNCSVNMNSSVTGFGGKDGRKRKICNNPDATESCDELYRQVNCGECQTEVAVMDKEEVYHFYNVISSHS